MGKKNAIPTDADRAGVDAVEIALKALRAVASSQGISSVELAVRLGVDERRLQFIVAALTSNGFLFKDVLKLYWLGPQLLHLGQQTSARNALIYASSEIMDDLVKETRMAVGLGAREEMGAIVLAVRDFPDVKQLIRLPHVAPSRGPLHTGGGSKVLLAYAPDDIIEAVIERDLEAFMPASITTREGVLQLLRKIREDEFYLSIGEIHPEIFTVNVPVRDPNGSVVAALGLMGLISNLGEATMGKLTPTLRDASIQITKRLG